VKVATIIVCTISADNFGAGSSGRERNYGSLGAPCGSGKRYNVAEDLFVETIIETARRRWLLLVAIPVLLLVAMPTTMPSLLVAEVRQAETAAQAGRIDSVLEHLDALILLQPQEQKYKIAAARMALLLDQPLQARAYLRQLPDSFMRTAEAVCLADRASLRLLEAPPSGWPGLIERCPAAAEDAEWYAGQLLQGAGYKNLPMLLSALQDAGISSEKWNIKKIFVQAALEPASSIPALREIIDNEPSHAGLALELLDTIERDADPSEPAYDYALVGQVFARSGEWQFAALAFERAVAVEPEYVEARTYLGFVLEQLGVDGLAMLQQAVKAAPDAALPHIFLARHYGRREDYPSAIHEMETASELEPGNPAIRAELGTLYAGNGELEAAVSAYQEATSLAAEDARFWLIFAQFSLNHEYQIEELGLPASRNAVVLSGGDPAAVDALGYGHLLRGDLLLAERLILQALHGEPGRAQTLYHLGLLRIHQGDAQAGLAAFRAAVQLDPDSPAGKLARRGAESLTH
jgi:tetratricopeptide (TPR) repeat protein